MSNNPVNEFNAYREKMNEKLLADNNKIVKRIFNLDTNAYAATLVGGTIVIPHLRRAYEFWEALENNKE